MALSIPYVFNLAAQTGLSRDEAITATAIAIAESGLNPGAVGDTTLQDGTWGPSIGLWQIRSLKAESGTGRSRDATRLKDPAFNARSMNIISSAGANWTPWSVYKSGAYRAHMAKVQAAVANVQIQYTQPSVQQGNPNSGLTAPTPTQGDPNATSPGTYHPVAVNGAQNVDFSIPGVDDLADTLVTGLVLAAAVGLGVTLIGIGAWRAVT